MENKVAALENLPMAKFKEAVKKESVKSLHQLKGHLDDVYYNTGGSVLEDDKYDYVKETLMKKDPDYKPTVGAKLREGDNKIRLPVWLGSMDKVTPKDPRELAKWLVMNKAGAKGYIVSDKLDGVSGLLEVEGGEYHLYTRGDGIEGSNITEILPYINYIPNNLSDIMVRGELIITVKAFETYYKGLYRNPRNMVSGLVNAKTSRKGLLDLDFVAYEIIYKNQEALSPSAQFQRLKNLGFREVRHKILKNLTIDELKVTLLEFKNKSPYEIDGLIVQDDKKYVRNTDGNPDYAFAFKMTLGENLAETEVEEVIWNISMRGMLKPRVKVSPVDLPGVTIEYATGFNAKFIEDNVIGPGAVVKITRSGDVIPYIVSVVSPAEEAQMPDVPYYWNETRVDIYAEEGGPDMCIKIMNYFFSTLGAKHVALQTLRKIYESGADTLVKLLKMKKSALLKIEGIQEKSADRIYTNIHNALQGVPLYKLMAATTIFGLGIGVKKMKALTQAFPDVMKEYKKMDRDELYDRIIGIEGFSEITTNKIIANLVWFEKFLKKTKGVITIEEKKKASRQNLAGTKFVFSGFRDKELEDKIEARGGAIVSSVSSHTTAVLTNNKALTTGKITKARALGVEILTPDEFVKKYL